MKKSVAVLSIILACMFGLCACGSDTKEVMDPLLTTEDAITLGEQTAEAIVSIVAQGARDQYLGNDVVIAGIDSWESALEDVGTYEGVISATADVDTQEAVISVTLGGTSHNAVMEIIVNESDFTSISTTVQYSFGEMMGKAGLNTLIGMGTVFCVLILISLLISLFKLIPKAQELFAKKKTDAEKDLKAEAVDNTIAQIIEKEEQSDDLELVAVIAAAIAASEGAASTDGFVVRSIRKRA